MEVRFKLYKCGICPFKIMLLPGLGVTCPDCLENAHRRRICEESELEPDTLENLGIDKEKTE